MDNKSKRLNNGDRSHIPSIFLESNDDATVIEGRSDWRRPIHSSPSNDQYKIDDDSNSNSIDIYASGYTIAEVDTSEFGVSFQENGRRRAGSSSEYNEKFSELMKTAKIALSKNVNRFSWLPNDSASSIEYNKKLSGFSVDNSREYKEFSDSHNPFQRDHGLKDELFEEIREVVSETDSKYTTKSLYGNSLFLFAPGSRIRRFLFRLHNNSKYRNFITTLTFVLMVFLAVRVTNPSDFHFLYSKKSGIDWFVGLMYVVFTFNDFTAVITYGFWNDSELCMENNIQYVTLLRQLGIISLFNSIKQRYRIQSDKFRWMKIMNFADKPIYISKQNDNLEQSLSIKRAFLRYPRGILQLISTTAFWLGLFFSGSKNIGAIAFFRSLATIRILLLLSLDNGIYAILGRLITIFPQLTKILFIWIYFWVYFSILGTSFFSGSLRRTCVWTNPDDSNDIYKNDSCFCGGYMNLLNGTTESFEYSNGILSGVAKGFICPQNSKCISDTNPYNNKISFDNIANSMELIFVIFSANTFTDLMYDLIGSDTLAIAIFFMASILILNVWLLNILIAQLVSSFELFEWKKRHVGVNKSIKKRIFSTQTITRLKKYIENKKIKGRLPNWSLRCEYFYKKVERIFILLIVFNLSIRSTVDESSTESYLEYVLKYELSFNYILLFESLYRLIIYSPNIWIFLSKIDYVIDLIIALITTISSTVHLYHNIGQVYNWLLFFNVLRFYRVVTIQFLFGSIWKDMLPYLNDIFNLSKLYYGATFLLSITASYLFLGIIPDSVSDDIQFGSYTLRNSFVSLLTVSSTENWTEVLYEFQGNSPTSFHAFLTAIFFIVFFVIIHIIIINTAVAIISSGLASRESEKRQLQLKHFLHTELPNQLQALRNVSLLEKLKQKVFKQDKEEQNEFQNLIFTGEAISLISSQIYLNENTDQAEDANKVNQDSIFTNIWQTLKSKVLSNQFFLILYDYYKGPRLKNNFDYLNFNVSDILSYDSRNNYNFSEIKNFMSRYPNYDNSYFLFGPKNFIRKVCQWLVPSSSGIRWNLQSNKTFADSFNKKPNIAITLCRDTFSVIVFIASISLVILNVISPVISSDPSFSEKFTWQNIIYIAVAICFSFEFLIRTVADGFIFGPNAYMNNNWNKFDFVIFVYIVSDVITIFYGDAGIASAFKTFTILRIIRYISISSHAREIFSIVLFDGLKVICKAAFISFCFLYPFSVWGLNLFRGKLNTCTDLSVDMTNCINEYKSKVFKFDIVAPRVYAEPYLNFNSIADSLRSLFEIISLEGWTDLLTNLMNSSGKGTVPYKFATPVNALFLLPYNMISTIFIVTLFISLILNNLSRTTGIDYESVDQKSWSGTRKLLTRTSPLYEPDINKKNKRRQFFYMLTIEKKSMPYNIFMDSVMLIHIVLLTAQYYEDFLTNANSLVVGFFLTSLTLLIDQLLFIYSFGFKKYFKNKWKGCKFTIIYTSWILSAIDLNINNQQYITKSFSRFCYSNIYLLLIPRIDILLQICEIALASFSQILSLTYCWFILLLSYSIALHQFFGYTKFGANTTYNVNFRTIPKAMILLFRMSFGEGWNYIMDDMKLEPPYCSYVDGTSDCGSVVYAYLILISWNILSMYIFLNMYTSLIVNNFNYTYSRDTLRTGIQLSDIRKFQRGWAKFDKAGCGTISFMLLPALMHSFDGSLSFKIWDDHLSIKRIVNECMTLVDSDPYNVKFHYKKTKDLLNGIDCKNIIKTKRRYNEFIYYIKIKCSYDNTLKFKDLINIIPLFTTYDPNKCLSIKNYVQYLSILAEVEKK
ncbi:hypothetical protein TPHA_0H01000 [Tetrapisispora phaffii CBS 4417]|uniref:Calcium-channel protein CCH1 n=1 Tax=Tetrapisispora phaffii (strain ATCC 24235 / CBS 4417 / NBRC 1672 / NRRL Y-8282 / UCD 70-5) TaxID=1071381 RepID=G8BX04_TETPH|nr:hypothetical protein TPHA_0H01000 [Tetrapisispora phaffii CBS 4417]CCE64308.1 hypothetical protein TPHA_0H01000 [Tetrapisispora phaffii CBS 4417]